MVKKKGMAPLIMLLIGVIVTLALTATLVPKTFTISHIIKVVEYEYKYDNAQLALVVLLSDESAYKQLSYFVAGMDENSACKTSNKLCFDKEEAKAAIEGRLDQLVASKCYVLTFRSGSEEQTIVDKKCGAKLKAKAFLALPYPAMTGEVTLAIK